MQSSLHKRPENLKEQLLSMKLPTSNRTDLLILTFERANTQDVNIYEDL